MDENIGSDNLNNNNNNNNNQSFKLQENHIAALAYVIFFLPLLIKPKTEFTMYHANQSFWLTIFAIFFSNFIGFVFSFLSFCIMPLITLVIFAYVLIGVINALNNKMVPLPGFAKLPTVLK